MTWIALLFFFEAGFSPMSQEWNHGNPEFPYLIEREELVTQSGARVLLFDEFLFIGANITTYATPSETDTPYPSFSPFRDTYQFEAGIQWRGIELGWLHECSHPVAPNHQLNRPLGREWAFDRLYIRYENTVDIW